MGTTIRACPILGALVLISCGSGGHGPSITEVVSSNPRPGSFLLISGQGFTRMDGVRIGGHAAAAVTWVNAQLLTAVIPPDAPPGPTTIEVVSLTGGRAVARDAVRIADTPAAEQAGAQTTASVTPLPAGTPPPGSPTAEPSAASTPDAQPSQAAAPAAPQPSVGPAHAAPPQHTAPPAGAGRPSRDKKR
jgi:hypothetical protein